MDLKPGTETSAHSGTDHIQSGVEQGSNKYTHSYKAPVPEKL